MSYIKIPNKIEDESFVIIDRIIKEERPDYKFKNEIEEKIIKRAIHTSADFEYLNILKISNDAVQKITKALKNEAIIYTDTNMALSGINKRKLKELNCEIRCYVSEEETAKMAKEKGITRSMASVLRASEEDKDKDKIFVVGNAPTALYRIMELEAENKLKPACIIGVPVGFVGAAESKTKLYESNLDYIVSLGRKGGSNIAASIVNAILYSL
ncbi:MAG: cobalt-precorrin-8 methylmutase [Peptostreptococcaceae bacterium]|jgi:precorrin-8X/cobalt-precorrin-8 methylmutase|nr:cobalt-precorrin-8 methylmutase [Peptostreptococcaceae bacterium]